MSTRYVYKGYPWSISIASTGDSVDWDYIDFRGQIYYCSESNLVYTSVGSSYVSGYLSNETSLDASGYSEGKTITLPSNVYFSFNGSFDWDIDGSNLMKTSSKVTLTVYDDEDEGKYFGFESTGSINYVEFDTFQKSSTLSTYYSSTYTNSILEKIGSSYYSYSYYGQDNIDPSAISLSSNLTAGQTATISLTASSGNVYGGTIYYRYEYSINNGSSWTYITQTTATSTTFTIPSSATQIKVRARASSDDFTSTDYKTSSNYTVKAAANVKVGISNVVRDSTPIVCAEGVIRKVVATKVSIDGIIKTV